MKRAAQLLSLLLCLLLLLGAPGIVAVRAQEGEEYDLTWSTVDGGGVTFSVGGDYALGGTIGQPDADVPEGGDYSLVGGFWGGASVTYRLYLPLLLRNA